MADWIEIQDLLDRRISLYTGGQTIGAGGGITVSPVLRLANIPASIQSLTGNEYLKYGKDLIEGTHYFMTLTDMPVKNGDIIVDDLNVRYRVTWWDNENVVTGRYFALIGVILRA